MIINVKTNKNIHAIMLLGCAGNMDYYLRIQAAVDYIEENIDKPIDLLDLSKKAFCSGGHKGFVAFDLYMPIAK
jgi:hypothetical protein